MSTSWTQADIDALEANIKRGILSVQFGDRQMQFQSISEMLKLRQEMKDAVASSSGGGKSRTSYAMTRKGSGTAGSRFGL